MVAVASIGEQQGYEVGGRIVCFQQVVVRQVFVCRAR